MFQFGNLNFCWKLGIRNWKLNLAFGIFLLDRILKGYAQHLPAGSVFSFLPGVQFKYSLNPALFFFPAWSFISWLALIILIAIFGFWIWNLIGNWEPRTRTTAPESSSVLDAASSVRGRLGIGNFLRHPLVPILLGGLSNVFDRFSYGGVVDYVEISGLARINLADILILVGILLLLWRRKA